MWFLGESQLQNRDRTESTEEQDASQRGIILQQGAGETS